MVRRMAAVVMVMLSLAGVSGAQGRAHGASDGTAGEPTTRYFEVTMVLRFGAGPGQEERTQSLMTDLAVVKDRPGASSGRARVLSQVPVQMQKGPTYLDLGTKLDCNDVRVEGKALAMAVVLETSSVNGTVRTVDKDGRSLEEPLIQQRNLSLQVRLPFGKPTVIFDTKNMDAGRLRPLPLPGGEGGATAGKAGTSAAGSSTTGAPPPATEMQVEMTARELP